MKVVSCSFLVLIISLPPRQGLTEAIHLPPEDEARSGGYKAKNSFRDPLPYGWYFGHNGSDGVSRHPLSSRPTKESLRSTMKLRYRLFRQKLERSQSIGDVHPLPLRPNQRANSSRREERGERNYRKRPGSDEERFSPSRNGRFRSPESPAGTPSPSIVVLSLLNLVREYKSSAKKTPSRGAGEAPSHLPTIIEPKTKTRGAVKRAQLLHAPTMGGDEGCAGHPFGPFSQGNDHNAGVSPSEVAVPDIDLTQLRLSQGVRDSLSKYLKPLVSALQPLRKSIPGLPGLDYPILNVVPYTNFYCSNMPWPGFYADTEARCQTWHSCNVDGRQTTFLCPNGTVFNQALMVCDWWYNFDCLAAPFLYPINERLFGNLRVEEAAKPHTRITPQLLDTIFAY